MREIVILLGQSQSCALFLLILWFVVPTSARGENPAELRARLAQEGPLAWKKYEGFWEKLQGPSSGERRELTGEKTGKVTLRVLYNRKQSGRNNLRQTEVYRDAFYKGTVAAQNSRYRFLLTRTEDQHPWAIQELSEGENAEEGEPSPVGLFFGNPPEYFPFIIAQPAFEIKSIENQDIDGQQFVHVVFQYLPGLNSPFNRDRGWVLLDPTLDWVIRKGEVEREWGDGSIVKQSFVNDYKMGSDGNPIPIKDVFASTAEKNGKTTSKYESIGMYDFQERDSVPDSEFMLSAFGLPEPAFPGSRRTPVYQWLAFLGFLCLGIAAIGWWIRKRGPIK